MKYSAGSLIREKSYTQRAVSAANSLLVSWMHILFEAPALLSWQGGHISAT